ncbi:MAG: Txe/YoeB family addiction module toxin [Nitrospirae bacterium]|nr:Txe/YoeB family addiction module toxin [Nitrospirota bacterium]
MAPQKEETYWFLLRYIEKLSLRKRPPISLRAKPCGKDLWRRKSVVRTFLLRWFVRSLGFDPNAFKDLEWWIEKDRKKALKIISLINEIQRTPFHGQGKPEKLKHELSNRWSRRIDHEHRIVYEVS